MKNVGQHVGILRLVLRDDIKKIQDTFPRHNLLKAEMWIGHTHTHILPLSIGVFEAIEEDPNSIGSVHIHVDIGSRSLK